MEYISTYMIHDTGTMKGTAMKPMTPFKNWVRELWMQHKDEYLDLKLPIPEKDLEEYFQKYKYWLKREYQHHRKLDNAR
jgi:predicted solute-binding protein